MMISELMIITTEVVSVIFMTVILCASIFGNSRKGRVTALFRCCLVSTILGAVFDALSYAVDGRMENELLLILINMVTYLTWVLVVFFFALYTTFLIEKRVAVQKWVPYPVAALTAVGLLSCVVGSFNGRLLYLEEGYFVEGPWGNRISLLLCAVVVYMYVILFLYRRALERSTIIVVAAFLFFPFLDTLVSLYLDIDYSYPILAVAFMVIYVVIQERTVAEDSIRKKLFEEASYTDPLTRSKNLRAYDEIIKADLRGSATAKVNFKLGDTSEENVLRFSEAVKTGFEGTDVFRTSEDEFEMLVYIKNEGVLEKKLDAFSERLKEDGINAAFTYGR